MIAPDAQPGGGDNVYYPGTTPGLHGSQAYFTVGGQGALTQTLGTTLQAHTTYTLSLRSGSRLSGETFAGYSVSLSAGTGVVGAWTGANRNLAAPGSFATTSRTFTTGANPAGLGEALRITLRAPGGGPVGYTDLDQIELTATAATPRPTGAPIDVFLVAGQSNAHGWQSDASGLSPANAHYASGPDARALLAYQQKNLGDPLYNTGSTGQLGTQGAGFAGNFDGFGPELSLGSDLAAQIGGQIAISKFAVGSAGLQANYRKTGATDPNPANHLYATILAQFEGTLQELRDQGFDPQLKALFWLQGESDTGDTAALYGANIQQFISDLRLDLSAPELKVFLTEINGNMPVLRDNPVQAAGTVLVNAGMTTAANLDERVYFVGASDLATGFADGIHYSADQSILIGQRWAGAYMASIPEPSTLVLLGLGFALLAGWKMRVRLKNVLPIKAF